jgi:APA family basic amino acid/polyamine antiporter
MMAVMVQAVVAIGLALSGRFDELTDYVVFAAWIFYALVTGAIFVFRIRNTNADRPYRVPGYPVLPAVFLIASVLLLGNTLVTQPADCIKGLCFILAGIPVYFYFRARKRNEAAAQKKN